MNQFMAPTDPRYRPARRRWRGGVALALSVALGFTGTIAASAVAVGDGDEPDASLSAAPPGRVVEFLMNPVSTSRYWAYGDSYTRPGTDIPFGTNTRTLLLDVDIAAVGPVECGFGQEDFGQSAVAQWTEEEWASDAPKAVPIAEGAVGEYRALYILRCTSTSPDGQKWTLVWWLGSEPTDKSALVVLVQDERLLSTFGRTYVYNTVGDSRPVFTGDTVRLAGAPGTWPQRGDVYDYDSDPTITLFSGAIGTESITVESSVIAEDGSTLEFIVPAAPHPEFFTEQATFSVEKSQLADSSGGSAASRVTATWSAPLMFAAQAAPTVDLSVARYALSFQRLNATAIVSPAQAGTVTFAVNGKPVGSAPAASGKATLRLPALARGRYSATATFTPAVGPAPAVSPGSWLRVLY